MKLGWKNIYEYSLFFSVHFRVSLFLEKYINAFLVTLDPITLRNTRK